MPLGQLIVGDLVAIVVVKQLFGGIGMNFANPALVGRIVLFISFAGSMNKWVYPDASGWTSCPARPRWPWQIPPS